MCIYIYILYVMLEYICYIFVNIYSYTFFYSEKYFKIK